MEKIWPYPAAHSSEIERFPVTSPSLGGFKECRITSTKPKKKKEFVGLDCL